MDPKTLKQLNSQLAASAQQEVRDKALEKLQQVIIKEKQWFEKEEKDLKMIWEGLFFMFWHSDKAVYQRDTAQKITKILNRLEQSGKDRQKKWFEAFIYIFNMHWDKVDNYRIDKYLLFLRFQFNEALQFLKKASYNLEDVTWFKETIKKLFNMEESIVSKGIPLQLCDVFLEELNAVDSQDISTQQLSSLLEPFLFAMSRCTNQILCLRIKERVFLPLLENNITPVLEEEEEVKEVKVGDEAAPKKWHDGGKYSVQMQKEIEKMVSQKFNFPNFNLLLFAQEYLIKYASDPETREENREDLYDLYDKAHNLEPKPEKPELTFTQRMLVNRAQLFMTKKMQKRLKFGKQKKAQKLVSKVGSLISAKMFGDQGEPQQPTIQSIFEQIKEKREYLNQLNEDFVKEVNAPSQQNGHVNGHSEDKKTVNGGTDTVINIQGSNQSKKKKKNKKRVFSESGQSNGNGEHDQQKRVKFDLNQSKTRVEFFMYGKVATQKVDESSNRASPSKGVIKQKLKSNGGKVAQKH